LIEVAEMCSGSEAGSYLRLKDFVYDSTLGLRVIKRKQKSCGIVMTQLERGRFGIHAYLAHKKHPPP
jgi:hypothetical protein